MCSKTVYEKCGGVHTHTSLCIRARLCTKKGNQVEGFLCRTRSELLSQDCTIEVRFPSIVDLIPAFLQELCWTFLSKKHWRMSTDRIVAGISVFRGLSSSRHYFTVLCFLQPLQTGKDAFAHDLKEFQPVGVTALPWQGREREHLSGHFLGTIKIFLVSQCLLSQLPASFKQMHCASPWFCSFCRKGVLQPPYHRYNPHVHHPYVNVPSIPSHPPWLQN